MLPPRNAERGMALCFHFAGGNLLFVFIFCVCVFGNFFLIMYILKNVVFWVWKSFEVFFQNIWKSLTFIVCFFALCFGGWEFLKGFLLYVFSKQND